MADWVVEADDVGMTAAVVTAQGAWVGAVGTDGTGKWLRPTSAHALASVTKTFVAAEVMSLAEGGRVDLDARVDEYLDPPPFDTGDATIRQVLGMQSGFPADPVDAIFEMSRDPGVASRHVDASDVYDLVDPTDRWGEPGGDTIYNNLNYLVLGSLVEEITGEPLSTDVRRDLLEPAGLVRVWYQDAEPPVPPLARAAPVDKGPYVDTTSAYLPSRFMSSAAGAAGGMAADALSLARWGYLLYGGRVVSPASVQEMTHSEGPDDWYGLGTILEELAGEPVVGHEGLLGVCHSLLTVWMTDGVSVAVLVPQSPDLTFIETRVVANELHDIVATE